MLCNFGSKIFLGLFGPKSRKIPQICRKSPRTRVCGGFSKSAKEMRFAKFTSVSIPRRISAQIDVLRELWSVFDHILDEFGTKVPNFASAITRAYGRISTWGHFFWGPYGGFCSDSTYSRGSRTPFSVRKKKFRKKKIFFDPLKPFFGPKKNLFFLEKKNFRPKFFFFFKKKFFFGPARGPLGRA